MMMPSDSVASQPGDIKLFAEQAIWFMRERGRTRLDFVNFVTRWVGPEARRLVLQVLPLSSKEQREAEEAVCRLLNPGVLTDSKVLRAREAPDRGTDWVRTYVLALYQPPLTYLEGYARRVLDQDLCGALVHLARSWEGQLVAADDWDSYSDRIDRLRQALKASRLRTIRAVGFADRHQRRLHLAHPNEARSIRDYFDLLRRRLGDEDESFLMKLADRIGRCTAENPNSLLEISVALSIARAACSGSQGETPETVDNWVLTGVGSERTVVPEMRLRRGALVCDIYKGLPRERHVGPRSTALDRRGRIAESLGLECVGKQPDFVLSFSLEPDNQTHVLAFADAKRNLAEGGTRYLSESVDVAIVYLFAYGHLMRLTVTNDEEAFLKGPIMPAFTLFCLQGVRLRGRGNGDDAIDRSKLIEFLQTAKPSDAFPFPVLALDLAHFGPSLPGSAWDAAVLRAWLDCLARHAEQALAGDSAWSTARYLPDASRALMQVANVGAGGA